MMFDMMLSQFRPAEPISESFFSPGKETIVKGFHPQLSLPPPVTHSMGTGALQLNKNNNTISYYLQVSVPETKFHLIIQYYRNYISFKLDPFINGIFSGLLSLSHRETTSTVCNCRD
jgi:hypothetical protein